jgi:hypothetical protein
MIQQITTLGVLLVADSSSVGSDLPRSLGRKHRRATSAEETQGGDGLGVFFACFFGAIGTSSDFSIEHRGSKLAVIADSVLP